VLIVDDEAATRTLLRKTVESCGCTVVEAADGDSALKLARTHQPALVLLDIVLPGSTTSGVLVCRELIEDLHIRVVIVSGNATSAIVRSCLSMGAVEIMRKPFPVDEIQEKLPGWLPS
jgi:CheY-like chemotaxis protein